MSAIYDPAKPPMLFDGLLKVYGTCQDCGETMQIINPDDKVHPTCTPPPMTRLESLLQGWLTCVQHGDREAEKLTAKEIEEITAEPPELAGAAVQYGEWGWHVFPLRAGCGIDTCRNCSPKAPCGKRPFIPKSKGGEGFKQAHCDIDRIDKWWARRPDCNIGLATGHVFDVIDIDPKSGGLQSFIKMLGRRELEHGKLCHKAALDRVLDGREASDVPERDICMGLEKYRKKKPCKCKPKIPHGIARTASGGLHLYIPATGTGNHARVRPGIDYRGVGGYVVAPPSTLGKAGREYSWLTEPSPKLKGEF